MVGGQLTTALDPADAATELFAGAGAAHEIRPDLDSDERHHDGEPNRDLERARSAASDAATSLNEAQRVLTDADQAARDAVTALHDLRARLEVAERTEHEARRRARSAQRDFETAQRVARKAHQRVHDLERRPTQQQSG